MLFLLSLKAKVSSMISLVSINNFIVTYFWRNVSILTSYKSYDADLCVTLGFKNLNFSLKLENLNDLQQNHYFHRLWNLTCDNCLLVAWLTRTLEIMKIWTVLRIIYWPLSSNFTMVLWLILLFSTASSFLRFSPSSSFVPCHCILWPGWYRLGEFFCVFYFWIQSCLCFC